MWLNFYPNRRTGKKQFLPDDAFLGGALRGHRSGGPTSHIRRKVAAQAAERATCVRVLGTTKGWPYWGRGTDCFSPHSFALKSPQRPHRTSLPPGRVGKPKGHWRSLCTTQNARIFRFRLIFFRSENLGRSREELTFPSGGGAPRGPPPWGSQVPRVSIS